MAGQLILDCDIRHTWTDDRLCFPFLLILINRLCTYVFEYMYLRIGELCTEERKKKGF